MNYLPQSITTQIVEWVGVKEHGNYTWIL